MNLKDTIIYFIDKENSNVQIPFTKASQHVDAYELLLKEKHLKNETLYDLNGNIYIPGTWTNYIITKELVQIGHLIFLNTRDGKCEIVLPESPNIKQIEDLEPLLEQLKDFKIMLWQVNKEGHIFDYEEKYYVNPFIKLNELINDIKNQKKKQ